MSDENRMHKALGLLAGVLAGASGGLLGIGGGAVMVPFMVDILKFSQHRAHGTSLVAVVFTGMAGAATYALHGSIDLHASVVLAITAVATSHFGARVAGRLPEWKLKRSFGIFLIISSLLLLAKPYLPAVGMGIEGLWARTALLMASGMLAGFLAGIMGGGGGIVMLPVLVLVLGFDQHLAQGTSLLVMVPAASVGASTHWKLGNVEGRLLGWIVPGLFLGAYLGASVAHLLHGGVLRGLFALVMIWTGIRYMREPAPVVPLSETP